MHRLEDDLVKMSVFPKLDHRFTTVLIISPADSFFLIDTVIVKLIQRYRGLQDGLNSAIREQS